MKETGEAVHRFNSQLICTKLHKACQVCLITERKAKCHAHQFGGFGNYFGGITFSQRFRKSLNLWDGLKNPGELG